jgi:hypothetical protein
MLGSNKILSGSLGLLMREAEDPSGTLREAFHASHQYSLLLS